MVSEVQHVMGTALDLWKYAKLLKEHDWTYAFSDDQRVWRKGEAERKVLEDMQKVLDNNFAIWNMKCPPEYKRTK